MAPTFLPVGKPVSLAEILSGYVELSQPATTQDLRILIEATTNDTVRAELTKLKDSYQDTVLLRRLSVLDLLEKYPKDLNLDLSTYLRMLPPMRIRQYSISSSPLWNAQHVTLTVSVLEAEALSGEGNVFLGVASNYLSELVPGDRVQMSVRASAAAFHPPEDPSIPLVAYCAGSGLAPIRGFIQVSFIDYFMESSLTAFVFRSEPCKRCPVGKSGRSFYFSVVVIPRPISCIATMIWRNGRSLVSWMSGQHSRGLQTSRKDASTSKSKCLWADRPTFFLIDMVFFQSSMG